MSLREKLKSFAMDNHIEKYAEHNAKELEKIADDYAIKFAEWCDENYFRMGNTSIWSDSTDWENNMKFTTKELCNVYKIQCRNF